MRYMDAVKTKATLVERVPQGFETFYLPVSGRRSIKPDGTILSPYFQLERRPDTTENLEGIRMAIANTGRDIQLISDFMKALMFTSQLTGQNDLDVQYVIYDNSNVFQGIFSTQCQVNNKNSSGPIQDAAVAAIVADAAIQGYTITANNVFSSRTLISEVAAMIAAASPAASYQTIVSQTGTAAPTVVGGMSPVNTYTVGTTFTWARSNVGIYTLTASSAVFSTSGKTSVFMTPPQNLNGSFKAVVTSSTVITFTTAVQSLAILGLLGFTATPTDVMLTGTMIDVRTYP